ncbi:hypothetical protein Adt_00615 [Abeliophyllum distichum]|uniref:Uncharacterized protein n=1 Tax=Abeliophyllum distichum TaxID=126358 RepID=A0ABD1VQK2_9LAMI
MKFPHHKPTHPSLSLLFQPTIPSFQPAPSRPQPGITPAPSRTSKTSQPNNHFICSLSPNFPIFGALNAQFLAGDEGCEYDHGSGGSGVSCGCGYGYDDSSGVKFQRHFSSFQNF